MSEIVPGSSTRTAVAVLRQPELRIVPLPAVTPHEDYAPSHEAGIAPLIEREGILRNPPIAAEIAPGRYTLLDGTHRLEALRRMGCGSVLVQHVQLDDPAAVTFATWENAARVEPDRFIAGLAEVGLQAEPASLPVAERLVAAGAAPAWMALYDGDLAPVFVLAGRGSRAAVLRALLPLCCPERLIVPAIHRGDVPDDLDLFADPALRWVNLLLRFAPFTAGEVVALARRGERIPAGVTRLLLPGGRVLGVNLPLDYLGAGAGPLAQQRWLAGLALATPRRVPGPAAVVEAVAGHSAPRLRRYDEPLVVFDPELAVLPV